MGQERHIEIDFAKGLLMLLVIFGHSSYFGYNQQGFEYANLLIYTFHMKCFLLLSGYLGFKSFTANQNILENLKKLFSGIIIPYLIFHTIYIFALSAVSGSIQTNTTVGALNFGNLVQSTLISPKGVYWYLMQLSYFFLFVIFANRISRDNSAGLIAIMCLLLTVAQMSEIIISPYLLIGAMLALFNIKPISSALSILPIIAILIAFHISFENSNLLLTLGLSINVLLFFFWLGRFANGKISKLLVAIGKNTMPIYVLHPFVLIFFKLSFIKTPLLIIDKSGTLHMLTAVFATTAICLLGGVIMHRLKIDKAIFGREIDLSFGKD